MSEETIPQMREQIKDLEKHLKEQTKVNTDLAKTNRVLQSRDTFRTMGYTPEVGELFAAQNPEGEITQESVESFVQKYGVGKGSESGQSGEGEAGAGEGESGSEPAPGSKNLATMSRGGSGAGEGGAGGSTTEPLTRQEWQALYASDPAAAQAAVRQGRVQISKDNVFSDMRPGPGNPYATSAQE